MTVAAQAINIVSGRLNSAMPIRMNRKLIDMVPVTPVCGAFTGPAGLFVLGGGGFSSWNSGATSGIGGGSEPESGLGAAIRERGYGRPAVPGALSRNPRTLGMVWMGREGGL